MLFGKYIISDNWLRFKGMRNTVIAMAKCKEKHVWLCIFRNIGREYHNSLTHRYVAIIKHYDIIDRDNIFSF